MQGRGRGSGIEIDAVFHDVYTVKERKVVRMDQFTDRAQALRSLQQP